MSKIRCSTCDGEGMVAVENKMEIDERQVDYKYHETCPECKGECYIDTEEKEDEEKIVYVNVYRVTRHYGGAEEGGWWYNWFDCIETYPVRLKNAEVIKEKLENDYSYIKEGDIYSALGGTDMVVYIEENPKHSETKERPYYE